MKECCKTGSEPERKKKGLQKWINYIIYIILALIVGGALILQLFS